MKNNIALNIDEQLSITVEAMLRAVDKNGNLKLSPIIEKYKTALNAKNERDKFIALNRILGLVRGCLEFTSDYEQEFLVEMGETEVLIKKYLALQV